MAQIVTVKSTGCGFDLHSRRWNIYLNLYFHFLVLVSRQSAALSSAIQQAMPPEFGRKCQRRVLTLGSLCLPCCVWHIAWIWFLYLKHLYVAWSNTILSIPSMQNWKILEHYELRRSTSVPSRKTVVACCVSPFIRLLEPCVSLFRRWLKNVWCLLHCIYLSTDIIKRFSQILVILNHVIYMILLFRN